MDVVRDEWEVMKNEMVPCAVVMMKVKFYTQPEVQRKKLTGINGGDHHQRTHRSRPHFARRGSKQLGQHRYAVVLRMNRDAIKWKARARWK